MTFHRTFQPSSGLFSNPRYAEAFRLSRPYAEAITAQDIAGKRVRPIHRESWTRGIQNAFAADALLGRSIERSALVQVPGLRAAVAAIGELSQAIDTADRRGETRRAA